MNPTGKTNTSALWVKLLLYIWSYIAVLTKGRRGMSKEKNVRRRRRETINKKEII